jgi:hypothetical protein
MAHTCNPSYTGGWDWEDSDSRPDWAKSLQNLISIEKIWAWWHTYLISGVPRGVKKEDHNLGTQWHNISKITREKMAEGMAQPFGRALALQMWRLESNASTTKNKKQQKPPTMLKNFKFTYNDYSLHIMIS